jgi:hypothetical protein
MGGLSYSQGMSDEARLFLEEQDAENRKALREAGVYVEGLTPQQYNQAMIEMGEWLKLPENRAYRNQRSAIGKFVDSVGGPFGLFALTAGPLVAFGGGLGAAGGAAGAGTAGAGAAGAGLGASAAEAAALAAAGVPASGLAGYGVSSGIGGALGAIGSGIGSAVSGIGSGIGSAVSGIGAALGAGGGSMGGLGTALALAGAELVGGLVQARAADKAAQNAAQMQGQATEAQLAAARQAADELRAGQAAVEQTLQPFIEITPQQIQNLGLYQRAGTQALEQQSALAGLQGPEAQRAAIANLEASPEFQALTRQGEEVLLQRAAATGGLRGGNIQGALAQFRPGMLQKYIDQQYSRLGGLSGQGLNVTQNLLNQGYGAATNLAGLRQAQAAGLANIQSGMGAAQAAGLANLGNIQQARETGQGQVLSNVLGNLGGLYGMYQGGYFGQPQTAPATFAGGYNPAAININAGLSTPVF